MRNNTAARQKAKNTINKHFGVDYAMQSSIVKKKSVDSCQRKYGVNNPMQNPETAFKNSLKHEDITVNHEYNLKQWSAKLDCTIQKVENQQILLYNDQIINLIDSLTYINIPGQITIYPWYSVNTVMQLLQHKYYMNTNIQEKHSLYLLDKETGYKLFKSHSVDILSTNKDHMFLGVYVDTNLYDAISITSNKNNAFFVDGRIGYYNIEQLYTDFTYNFGIHLTSRRTVFSSGHEEIVWYKGEDRVLDTERKEARHKMCHKGWRPCKVIIDELPINVKPSFSIINQIKAEEK